jgi:two-component system, LytTR family, sensor kinase
MPSSRRSTLTAILAASFLALLEIFRTNATRVLEGESVDAIAISHRVLAVWVTIVVVSPWCAFMARRFPFRGDHTFRTVLAHVGGAGVFVALHLALLITFHALVMGDSIPSAPRLVHTYFFYVALEMSVYAAIVIVILLLDSRREAAERAVTEARLAEHLASARLESLQAQIRPHFLFNTLNALAILARKGDGAAVDRAIGDLGELLRASFDAPPRSEIRLDTELAFVERYLGLQRIRFPDRLHVEWDIENDARAALVPELLLQPLVENALEHGLARADGGRIGIRARREGDLLSLTVDDDGPGFTAADRKDKGLGLGNTRERLSLLYGSRATLLCGDQPGGGGVVRVRLPWRTVAPQDGAP